MDIIERHRIAFSNIGSQLFGDLEKDLELALKKGKSQTFMCQLMITRNLRDIRSAGVEEQAEQDKVIEDLNRRLQEQELLVGFYPAIYKWYGLSNLHVFSNDSLACMNGRNRSI